MIARAFVVVFVLSIMTLGVGCKVSLWNERREAGHSRLYCWWTVTRR